MKKIIVSIFIFSLSISLYGRKIHGDQYNFERIYTRARIVSIKKKSVTLVNTLILAYVGSSLSLILLIAIKLQPAMPFWMVLNYNPVLSEIVKSVIGSIGMFLCIPLTAFIAVKLYKKKVYSQP